MVEENNGLAAPSRAFMLSQDFDPFPFLTHHCTASVISLSFFAFFVSVRGSQQDYCFGGCAMVSGHLSVVSRQLSPAAGLCYRAVACEAGGQQAWSGAYCDDDGKQGEQLPPYRQ